MNKYKLSLQWDDFDQSELFLVDKRAQIKTELKIVTVPNDLQRAHHIEVVEPRLTPVKSSRPSADVAFEVACVKALKEETNTKLSIEQALKLHDPKYAKMIQAHP